MKIILFGTGSTAEKLLRTINDEVELVAVADNDEQKWGKLWNGHMVINPREINGCDYDYVLIGSMFTEEIIDSLLAKGVKREKIIPYFNNYNWQEQVRKENLIKGSFSNNVSIKNCIINEKKFWL